METKHSADDRQRITNHLLRSVKKTIEKYQMIHQGDAVLLGVSGGPDSVALAHVFKHLSDPYEITLGIAHLNHGLRQDAADNDERFVKTLARSLGILVHTEKQNVEAHAAEKGRSIEEAGRNLRYDFFSRLAQEQGYQRIAVGPNCSAAIVI